MSHAEGVMGRIPSSKHLAVVASLGAWLGTMVSTARAAEEATAGPPEPLEVVKREAGPPRTFVNLRAGAASFNPRHPEVCVEGAPLRLLSFEACGTGSGFLHRDPAPAMSHFRARLQPWAWETKRGWLQPMVGLGFAELQVGEDAPGFDFTGTGAGGVETAGGELALGLRMIVPVDYGLELIGELNVAGAWFPRAPELTRSMGAFQPSAALTVGAGF